MRFKSSPIAIEVGRAKTPGNSTRMVAAKTLLLYATLIRVPGTTLISPGSGSAAAVLNIVAILPTKMPLAMSVSMRLAS